MDATQTSLPSRARRLSATMVLAAALALTACAAPDAPATPTASPETSAPSGSAVGRTSAAPGSVTLPPVGAAFDYQLGGAYQPADGVRIVARDRAATPATGLYNICYVNAFQTQPGERAFWPDALLLRDGAGAPMIDPDWPDEIIVDTRQPGGVADIVTPWIRSCAEAGFDAVEFDNLDTYTRTDGALSRDDNLALARTLVAAAHRNGLAAAQKNAAEDSALLHDEAGFDFAVTEGCVAFSECGAFVDVYGPRVLAIEYTDMLDRPFVDICADVSLPASLVLRDRRLVTPSNAGYVFQTCR